MRPESFYRSLDTHLRTFAWQAGFTSYHLTRKRCDVTFHHVLISITRLCSGRRRSMEEKKMFSLAISQRITGSRTTTAAHRSRLSECCLRCVASRLYRSHRRKKEANSGFHEKKRSALGSTNVLCDYNCTTLFAHNLTDACGDDKDRQNRSFGLSSTFLWKFYAWLKLFIDSTRLLSSNFGLSSPADLIPDAKKNFINFMFILWQSSSNKTIIDFIAFIFKFDGSPRFQPPLRAPELVEHDSSLRSKTRSWIDSREMFEKCWEINQHHARQTFFACSLKTCCAFLPWERCGRQPERKPYVICPKYQCNPDTFSGRLPHGRRFLVSEHCCRFNILC